jgi:hypothetical protein
MQVCFWHLAAGIGINHWMQVSIANGIGIPHRLALLMANTDVPPSK